jgi:hypothetical protein
MNNQQILVGRESEPDGHCRARRDLGKQRADGSAIRPYQKK